jgi:hypothetical protein
MRQVPKVQLQPQTDTPNPIRPVDCLLILLFLGLIAVATINHPLRDPRPVNPTCEIR